MSKPHRPPGTRDYEIGYGRPREKTRFQPGRSGNPKGRPRKRKTVGAIVDETLARAIKIEENGRFRSLSAEEIIIRQLVNKAAKGDLKAAKMAFELKQRYRESPAESINLQDLQSDKEILDGYLARLNAGRPNASPKSTTVECDADNPSEAGLAASSDKTGEEA